MNLLFWYRSLMRSVGAALVKLIVTATSGLVSFTTNVIRPVKVTCEFSPIQEGTGDPSPDNVRPISGWTGCEISKARKNLLKPVSDSEFWQNGYIRNDGTVTADNAYRITDFISIRPGIDYTFFVWQIDEITSFDGWKGIAFYDGNKTFIPGSFWQGTISQLRHVVSPNNAMYVRVYTVPETCPQLGIETTVTAYEPYQGEHFPINWQTEAGTVYGGTVTLNEDGSADVVVNKAKITYVGNASESWSKFGSGSASAFAMKHPLSNFINTDGAIVADYLVTIAKDASWGSYDNWVSWANPNVLVTGIKSITTVAAWEAYLAENPLTIVYNLKSSLSYHLDNVGQLQSFLGTNNIWHNMNGGITVEYWNKQ